MMTEWLTEAEATAALATASAAAVVGKSHRITAVRVSYGAAQIGTVTIKQGAVVLLKQNVHTEKDIVFANPLVIAPNAAVSVELSAGAATVVGNVTMEGSTVSG